MTIREWLVGFLSVRGLERADGRPLYAYKLTDTELARIGNLLKEVAIRLGRDVFRENMFGALFL